MKVIIGIPLFIFVVYYLVTYDPKEEAKPNQTMIDEMEQELMQRFDELDYSMYIQDVDLHLVHTHKYETEQIPFLERTSHEYIYEVNMGADRPFSLSSTTRTASNVC